MSKEKFLRVECPVCRAFVLIPFSELRLEGFIETVKYRCEKCNADSYNRIVELEVVIPPKGDTLDIPKKVIKEKKNA